MQILSARSIALGARAARNTFTKRPFCLSFEITHRCNALCKHCNRGGQVKFFNVNPDGTLSPCGLIITNYKSRKELLDNNSEYLYLLLYCYSWKF